MGNVGPVVQAQLAGALTGKCNSGCSCTLSAPAGTAFHLIFLDDIELAKAPDSTRVAKDAQVAHNPTDQGLGRIPKP